MSPRWEQLPSGAYVPGREPSVVIFGDSITNQCTNAAGHNNAIGYMTWANIFSHQRLELLDNAGVGGDQVDEMLARIAADVLSFEPGYCVVAGGINDVANGRSHAAIVADLEDIYDALLAADVKPILCTITPSTAIDTAGEKAIRESVNEWMRDYVTAHPATTLLCDWGDVYADVNGDPVANMTSDGTHPSARGAQLMGMVLATVIKAEVTNDADSLHRLPNTAGEPDIVTLNPLFTGDSSGKATSWTFTADAAPMTFVHSKVARTDGKPGVWQQIAATNPNHTLWEVYQQNTAVNTDWAVGDTVWAALEFEYDAGATLAGDWFGCGIRFYNGVGAIYDNFAASAELDQDDLPDGPISGVFLTPKAVVPATTTRLQFYLMAQAEGTFRICRGAIFRTRA